MSEEKRPEEIKEPESEPKKATPIMPLRTQDDLVDAHEWLFNSQKDGRIDSKTADGLNTTLKGSVYLNGKLKLDYLKIYIQAKVKKIDLPVGFLPK